MGCDYFWLLFQFIWRWCHLLIVHSHWPNLSFWSVIDQMDPIVGRMSRKACVCMKVTISFICKSLLSAEDAERKDSPAFTELAAQRESNHVNHRWLEFSYPFKKRWLSMSCVLSTGDLSGTRKTKSLPLRNLHSCGRIRQSASHIERTSWHVCKVSDVNILSEEMESERCEDLFWKEWLNNLLWQEDIQFST